MRRSRTHARAVGLTTALTLLVGGCSLLPGQGSDPTPVPSEATSPPDGREGLARYYGQQLAWEDCQGGQCSWLEVPVDYDAPDGSTIKLRVLKAKAKGRNRIGSLVLNPGGPGGSGVQYASYADYVVSGTVRDRYDVVGFDPRGVGQSAPVDCLDDADLDTFLGMDPTPDDAQERAELAAEGKKMAQGCKTRGGELAAHVSTPEAAQDMDVLRAALGESRLTYLGKSYGTYLGATYAELFPSKVGRFVLDGVVAPDLTTAEMNIGQAKGFDTATRAWAKACVDDGGCPLGSSADDVIATMQAELEDLDRSPVDGGNGITLTEGWATLGIAQAMYDQGSWDSLTQALVRLRQGNGTDLMQMAMQYADRSSSGTYSGNIMEVIYAVNCLDHPEPAGAERDEMMAKATAEAPIWGEQIGGGSSACADWPWPPTTQPHTIAAKGAAPILVIGTTRDPATPYEWAKRLHEQLAASRLITHEGDGHTAYMRQNSCVDKAVDAYLVDGDLPKDDLTCS